MSAADPTGVHADLALAEDVLTFGGGDERRQFGRDALARVAAELERRGSIESDLEHQDDRRAYWRARAEAAERELVRLRDGLRRIADEPPDRGLTPNFREFARSLLASSSDTPMPCGHPETAVVQADEGTAYCRECASPEGSGSEERVPKVGRFRAGPRPTS